MSTLLIKNAKFVLPDAVTETISLLVENGVIVSIGETVKNADKVFDANGNYILPGFAEIHFHG